MSQNIFDIIKRIKEYKGLNSDASVSRILGFKERRGLQYYKENELIPFEHLFNFADKENISLNWLIYGFGSTFQDNNAVVNESPAAYTIPPNCPAPPVCQEICKKCKGLHPDDQTRVKQLTEILTSDDKDTKDAIKSNLKAFYRDVKRYKQDRGESTDFKIQEL